MKNKKVLNIVIASVCFLFAVIFVAVIIVAEVLTDKYADLITRYFGHQDYEVVDSGDGNEDTEYFKREYTTRQSRLDADGALGQEIEAEGIVLLKNENSALPVATSPENEKKVTMFGIGSRDFVYGGTGSGSVDTSTAPTLQDALRAANYDVNPTMADFYTKGRGKNYEHEVRDIAGNGDYVINECPANMFTKGVKNSFSEYSDMAIVVLNRSGSESSDLPTISASDPTRSYLELTAEEESLLAEVSKAEYGFDCVTVIINSATPMELGFLDDSAYDIDACIWVGNVGQTGMYAIGEVLNGTVNPSGALVDTYAYDTLGAPSVQNQGAYAITNATNTKGSSYMVYAEGIYVGYRYYETRYEDSVLNQGNASSSKGVTKSGAAEWNYADEVQFPFGYGESYTMFEWSDFEVAETDESFEISLTVTNTGNYDGKDIVQIYMQSPYTDYDKSNNIEKASVELVGFAKTDNLAAGGGAGSSETVNISVSKELLKTYDAYGEGTYIVDAGTYYFSAGNNAHDALNNILAAKGKTTADGMDYNGNADFVQSYEISADHDTYSVSQVDGEYKIVNRFNDVDIKTYDENFTYLSRSDWDATYPVTYKGGRWEAPEAIVSGVNPVFTADPEAQKPVQNANNGLNLAMFMQTDPESAAWDDLIDQMSYDDMATLVKDGGYGTKFISSINAPATVNLDGPSGVLSIAGISITFDEPTFSWPCEVVLAATWNTELAERMGEMVGEDALANSQNTNKIAGWYAPAMNIHRSAYSGRNFEYYSEDSFLSGVIGAAETKGATSKGLITFIKHFALNDQETGRTGGLMFANEQSVRELYLKPFEYAVRDGGSLGIMSSMNRIGVKWSGGHSGLMTETLRNEWGFKGVAVTDQASYSSSYYMDIKQGLSAGNDLWLNTDSTLWLDESQLGDYANNATLLNDMREASKHILYAVSRSLAMNGLSSSSEMVPVNPLWKNWLIGADVALAVVAAGLSGIGVWQMVRFVRMGKQKG